MKRRDFALALGGTVALWPLAGASAQARVPTVGMLIAGEREPFLGYMLGGLRQAGRIEGQNYRLELRSAQGDAARLPELAAELVRLKVDVIVAAQTPAATAAFKATKTIPIVGSAGDPIGTGLAVSLARPGGNFTGVSGATADIAGKSLELIREIVPAVRLVAILANATDPFTRPFLEQLRLASRASGIAILPLEVGGAGEFETAFARMVRDKADAVIVQPSLPRKPAADLAIRHKLPSVSPSTPFVHAGGLISYSPHVREIYGRLGVYVDKILKGAKPADLPIETPLKFELAINVKTATAIGLTIAPVMLARADEVIE